MEPRPVREDHAVFTVAEAAMRLGEVVNRARHTDAPIRLTQHGQTAAWVISDALMGQLRHLENQRDLVLLASIKDEGCDAWIPHEEVSEMLARQLAPESEERCG